MEPTVTSQRRLGWRPYFVLLLGIALTLSAALYVGQNPFSIRFYSPDGINLLSIPALSLVLVSGSLLAVALFFGSRAGAVSRGKAEQAAIDLLAQQEWFQVTLSSVGDGVIATDTSGRVQFINPTAEQLTGWKLAEAIGRPLSEVFVTLNEETREPAPDQADHIIQSGGVAGITNHTLLISRQGTERAIDDRAAPIRHSGGDLIGVVVVFHDVTDQRRSERRSATQYLLTQVLAESKSIEEAAPKILRVLGETLHFDFGAFWQVDPSEGEGRATSFWQAAGRHFPEFKQATELLPLQPGLGLPGRILASGESAWIEFLGDDANFPRAKAAEAGGLKTGFGFPVMNRGKMVGIVEMFSRQEQERDPEFFKMTAGVGTQIGQFLERQLAEAQLRQSEELHRTISETAADCILTMDGQSRILSANEGAARIFGHLPSELIGQSMTEIMPERMRHAHRIGLERFMNSGRKNIPWDRIELPGLHKNGQEIPLEMSFGMSIRDGRPIFTAIVRDITDRKKADLALSESQKELQLIINALPVLIGYVDAEQKFSFNNLAFEQWFGFVPGAIRGTHVRNVVGAQAYARLLSRIESALSGQEVEFEEKLARKNGEMRDVHGTFIPHRAKEESVAGFYVLVVDVTERKKAEEANRFLAEAGKILAQSLGHRGGLIDMAHLAVPRLADWCVVDLVDEGKVPVRLAVVHRDPLKVTEAADLPRDYPTSLNRPEDGAGMIGHGEGLLYRRVDDIFLKSVARDESHFQKLKVLRLFSGLSVPIKARNKVFGSISFWRSETEQSYDQVDLELAQELALRAGLAVDNALLYREAQREIVERRQIQAALSESEERFRLIVERAQEYAIFMIDPQQRISSWNPAAERILGYPESEILGKDGAILFTEEDRAARVPEKEIETAYQGGQAIDERWHVRKDGSRFWASGTMISLRDDEGRLRGYAKIMRDITERKQTEEAIQKINQELEERVEQRTADLRETNEQMEAFTYSVAHDLRSPLRAMQGYSQALLEDEGATLKPNGRNYLQRIMDSARRMDGLIQDLLEYSRLSRSELRFREIALESVVEAVLLTFREEIQQRSAQITVEKPLPVIFGHPSTMELLLGNLISNAMKFVAKSSVPEVRIWAEQKGRMVRLWVEDRGIGIDPRHAEKIFRVFERLHDAETFPGTGIGLAIVRKGAERMGGRAGVESVPGEGSRFWIEMPAFEPKAPGQVRVTTA